MMSAPVEQKMFEAMKPHLVKKHPGQFAVLCGRRLLGVFETVDEALYASSCEFEAGKLPEGATIFISEIAEKASVRVTARPYVRGEGRTRRETRESRQSRTKAGEIRA